MMYFLLTYFSPVTFFTYRLVIGSRCGYPALRLISRPESRPEKEKNTNIR